MAERFTLQIFADTSQASSALKQFATEQEAIARRLRTEASTPAQARALAAPQFQQLGYATRALGAAQTAGTIPDTEVKALRAAIAAQAAQLREGLVGAGLTEKEARSEQQRGYLAGQRAANADLLASKEAEAKAHQAAAAQTASNATEEEAASEKVQSAKEKERAALQKSLAATLARARRELALSQNPQFLAAQATLAASRDRVRTSVLQDPRVQKARAERIAAEAAVKNAAAADAATQAAVQETLARKVLAERLARQAATTRALLDPVLQRQMAERIAAEKVATNSARTKAAQDAGVTRTLSERLAAERTQAQLARARLFADESYIKATTERTVQERLANRIARERAASDIRLIAANQQAQAAASPFQRLYGRVTGSPATNAPTGGQFFGRKLATTAGYGLSSIALFGAIGGIAASVKEAEQLDRVLNDIAFQLDSFADRGIAVPGIDEVRQDILGIARDTGLAADEVGRVLFQLQGAFGGDTVRALRETAAAAEFVRLTGLSLEETVDSFTALTQSFSDGTLSAREFGDTAFGLQERFGVLAQEILTFASDLAPVAETAGFTVQELQALGAAAQKFSGRPGSALSEAFGRIIPQVQERAAEFIGLFQQTPSLRPLADDIAQAFAAGDIQQVFEILLASYNDLSRTQQNFVIDLLGGRREAASLIAVLENGDEVLREWNGTFDDTGKQSQRFARFQDTLTQQLAKFGEQLSQLGIQIFESGFKDLLEFILSSGTGVVSVLGDITSVFTGLNSALGGIPGQLLAIVAALKLLQAVGNTALAGRLLGGFAPGAAGAAGARGTGRFAGLFQSPLTAFGGVLGAYGTQPTPTGFGTLSGRAAINNGATLGGPGAIRSAFQTQGFRATASTFWGNATQGIKSGFAANKGLIAATGLILGTQLLTQLTDSMRQTAEEQGRSRVAGLGEQLAAGLALSPAEREQLEREAARGGLSNAQRVRDNVGNVPIVGELVAAGIGLFTGGQDRNQAAAAEARSILAEQVAADLQVQVDAVRNAGLLGVEEGIRIFTVTDGQQSFVSGEELQRIVDKAASGEALTPGEFQIFQELQRAIPRAIEQNEDVAEAILGTQEEQNFSARAQNLEAVRARYEAGSASRGEFLRALSRSAAGARELIEAGVQDEEVLADALARINEFREEVSQGLVDSLDRLQELRSLRTGRDNLRQNASELLTLIRSGRLTPEDRTEALNEYFQVQQELLQEMADAANTTAEANRILREGIAVPADIRALAILDQLNNNVDYSQFVEGQNQTVTDLVGNLNQFNRQTAELMVAYGLSARDARLAVIDGLIEDYERILDTAVSGLDAQGAQRALSALREERQRILNNARLGNVRTEDPARIRGEQQDAEQRQDERRQRLAEIADAQFALQESLTEDPVALARIAVARAQDALRRARGRAEILQAQAELNNAQRELRDRIRDVYDSQFELVESMVEDPVELARIALRQALENLRRARLTGNDAAINAALAQVNETRRGVRDAIQAAQDAQTQLLIAIADAAGNTVQAARLAYRQAVRELRRLRQQDAGDAAIRQARAQVVTTSAGVRDALLNNRRDHYQFLYDMGRITTGQLISYLQSLLQIPNLTQQQIRDIQLQIRNLRQELGQDFQFNLPTELALPTYFEARRADQLGGRNFTDNRQVTIQVNVSQNADLQALEAVLADAVGTNVNGTVARRY